MNMAWLRPIALAKLKQIDRDTLITLLAGSHRLFSLAWWRQKAWRWLMAHLSAHDIFGLIYAKNIWGVDESRSGAGSTLAETTNLRQTLPAILKQLNISSLLDIPCGDFNWMSRVDLSDIRYIGADIVPELVAETVRQYAGSNREFLCLDLIADALPKTDLIFCRDCLVHLPNREVLKALANIRASGATYLLTTTFPARQMNEDIVLGYWRPINLERPPFNLPPPVALLHEDNPDPGFADKSLGVWRIADLSEDKT